MGKRSDLLCAASLVHHGLLRSVESLLLLDVDLSPVPDQQLVSLASCVTRYLNIKNVSGCDLASILSSLKCEQLIFTRQRVGRKETQALVQAMESGVKEVYIGYGVTLDIEALTDYSGQGVCREITLMGDTADRYREEPRTWIRSRNLNETVILNIINISFE